MYMLSNCVFTPKSKSSLRLGGWLSKWISDEKVLLKYKSLEKGSTELPCRETYND